MEMFPVIAYFKTEIGQAKFVSPQKERKKQEKSNFCVANSFNEFIFS